MSLQGALDSLKKAAGDLASLEVQTYVGEIDVVIDGVDDATDFEKSLKQAKSNDKIKLTLVTKLKFDGDAFVLVPASAPADYVQQAHNAALKAGDDARKGLIALFGDAIGLKVTT